MKKKLLFLLKAWAVMIGIGFVILIVVGVVVGVGVMTGEVGAVVTQDEFECVRNGMTYRQVVACIGEQGTEEMTIGSMVTYGWSNPNMTSASVAFDNGRVASKIAMGGLP